MYLPPPVPLVLSLFTLLFPGWTVQPSPAEIKSPSSPFILLVSDLDSRSYASLRPLHVRRLDLRPREASEDAAPTGRSSFSHLLPLSTSILPSRLLPADRPLSPTSILSELNWLTYEGKGRRVESTSEIETRRISLGQFPFRSHSSVLFLPLPCFLHSTYFRPQTLSRNLLFLRCIDSRKKRLGWMEKTLSFLHLLLPSSSRPSFIFLLDGFPSRLAADLVASQRR